MTRIHGDIKILRKHDVKEMPYYGRYKESLREDFGRICGYCGKSELVTKNTFEIDHFIPVKLAPEKKNDYSNLVYSCYECNRKKSGKWLSGDKNIQFVEGKGFVDPATDEFDNNLERDDMGNIVGKTPAGKYMVEEGFEFNKRPIREVYKAMLLIEKIQQLKEKTKKVPNDESQQCLEALVTLEQILFDHKE